MSDTPITNALSSDPSIEKRDVPTRVWRVMEIIERQLSAANQRIKELEAERDAFKKDAERYQWLIVGSKRNRVYSALDAAMQKDKP